MSIQKNRIDGEFPKHSKENTAGVNTKIHNSKEAVQYWIDFSCNPQKPEDVRQHLLTDKLRDQICITFICQYHPMSCEFIEELVALSTNLFDFETYTEENIKFVLDVVKCLTKEEAERVVDEYKKKFPNNTFIQTKEANNINTRVDWFNIAKHQTIEPWFKEKWGEHFKAHLSASSRSEMSSWENY